MYLSTVTPIRSLARTFFAVSSRVFRATATNMGHNELESSQQPSLAKGDLQNE